MRSVNEMASIPRLEAMRQRQLDRSSEVREARQLLGNAWFFLSNETIAVH